MADIVLSTLNAKYAHTAFGLRYLLANMGPLKERTALCEYTINDRPIDIVESLVAQAPRIVGFGVYIWNVAQTYEVVRMLKALLPNTVVVLGGPEVSHETAGQAIVDAADVVICGEADRAFGEVCADILAGALPPHKIVHAALPDVGALCLPYGLYTDEDLRQRVVYVEASRGCPFKCEFCLSSLDEKVRRFDLDVFLGELDALLQRGARQFKFIDRTFNLHLSTSRAILQFFLDRYEDGLFVHFEMVPDRLPRELRDIIAQFPAGALQFEIGVQTLNPAVETRISRRQDQKKLADNLAFLNGETGVHLHVDLIVGLPGEDLDSFAAGFDKLIAMGPQEIQVGILKRLRGTPLARHTQTFAQVYSPLPPYEILATGALPFEAVQTMKRFARFWDLVVNRGTFRRTAPRLWQEGSPFWQFHAFTQWLHGRLNKTHAIAQDRLAESLLAYLTEELGQPRGEVGETLLDDYHRGVVRRTPAFLAPFDTALTSRLQSAPAKRQALPQRQAAHAKAL